MPQSVLWDEAVKINGADPDFHRRDLWNAIDAGDFPEWEFAVQTVDEARADELPFDILDATKLIPEELVPLEVIGKMVLNRNPDNFFAETEQVAFCPANIVPGIDFSNDPLLQGRLFSYLDTQLIRLGRPELPRARDQSPEVPVAEPPARRSHAHDGGEGSRRATSPTASIPAGRARTPKRGFTQRRRARRAAPRCARVPRASPITTARRVCSGAR